MGGRLVRLTGFPMVILVVSEVGGRRVCKHGGVCE